MRNSRSIRKTLVSHGFRRYGDGWVLHSPAYGGLYVCRGEKGWELHVVQGATQRKTYRFTTPTELQQILKTVGEYLYA